MKAAAHLADAAEIFRRLGMAAELSRAEALLAPASTQEVAGNSP